jgi:hypothetical protein
MKGPRAELIGDDNRKMLNVARKYKMNLAAIWLSTEIQMRLPAWCHPFNKPQPITNATSQCLLSKKAQGKDDSRTSEISEKT